MGKENIDGFVDELCHIHHSDKIEIKRLEEKYSCKIFLDVEKIHALQHIYYFEVDFGKEENFFAEIESGINNGTQINNESWGYSSKEKTKIVEVLKDIVLDENYYKEMPILLRTKAQAVLSSNKQNLFNFHRQDAYDNYVTGGNSKMKLNPLLSQLRLNYIYEEKEVYKTFI